jgi:5-methylcytosine-specific restriction endonuclease McrA
MLRPSTRVGRSFSGGAPVDVVGIRPASARSRPEIVGICGWCQETFRRRWFGRPPTRSYCSEVCRVRLAEGGIPPWARDERYCLHCKGPLSGSTTRRFCSDQCRGRFHHQGKGTRVLRHSCEICGTIWSSTSKRARFCSLTCQRYGQPAPTEKNRKGRRRLAESMAAGLGTGRRSALLRRWQRQGHACWACGAAPTTVDHLIPLARGGTNFEGNLAPACKGCNSSRGKKLIVEWRLRARSTAEALQPAA